VLVENGCTGLFFKLPSKMSLPHRFRPLRFEEPAFSVFIFYLWRNLCNSLIRSRLSYVSPRSWAFVLVGEGEDFPPPQTRTCLP